MLHENFMAQLCKLERGHKQRPRPISNIYKIGDMVINLMTRGLSRVFLN